MYGIGKIVKNKIGSLIFSLLCGLAYFIIILDYIVKSTKNGGILLGFFFFPAIVAGIALILIKTFNRLTDEENYKAINVIMYLHIILIFISIVFAFDLISIF